MHIHSFHRVKDMQEEFELDTRWTTLENKNNILQERLEVRAQHAGFGYGEKGGVCGNDTSLIRHVLTVRVLSPPILPHNVTAHHHHPPPPVFHQWNQRSQRASPRAHHHLSYLSGVCALVWSRGLGVEQMLRYLAIAALIICGRLCAYACT